MKSGKYRESKKVVEESLKKRALLLLIEKRENIKSVNAKGILLNYNQSELEKYVCPDDENIKKKNINGC